MGRSILSFHYYSCLYLFPKYTVRSFSLDVFFKVFATVNLNILMDPLLTDRHCYYILFLIYVDLFGLSHSYSLSMLIGSSSSSVSAGPSEHRAGAGGPV